MALAFAAVPATLHPSAELLASHAGLAQPESVGQRPTATWHSRGGVCALSGAAVAVAAVTRKQQRTNRACRLAEAKPTEVEATKPKEETEEAPVEAIPEKPKPAPFNPAAQVGVTEPLGYFDPLGFCPVGDRETFYNYRCAEIKHGRVAMMASLGAVVQPWFQFWGFWDVPKGLSAAWEAPGSYGFFFLVLFAGVLEGIFWAQDDFKEPGDFGDPLGFNIYDRDMRNRELNNGRLAMFTALGIMAAELYTGKDAMQQLGIVVPRNFDI
mmetsp:Transcript_27696/g.50619  ORF Transcript_27696/g.50619 Transcript_27696/m.50619 type:complete len:268 (-) Transcript_27696:134-937(-)